MTTIGSPSNIETLLAAFAKCDPVDPESPAIKQLTEIGAVAHHGDNIYRTTKFGDAWVKALCNTPPPILAYLDAQGKPL